MDVSSLTPSHAYLEPLPTTRELARHPTRQPQLLLLLLSISITASANAHGFKPGASRRHRGLRSRSAAPAVAVLGRDPGGLGKAYAVHLHRDCRWLFLIEETAHGFRQMTRLLAADGRTNSEGSYLTSHLGVPVVNWASTHNRERGI